MNTDVFWKALLIFSSGLGFLLTLYIYHKKHAHEKMMCPIGGKCDSVMKSEYATFLGLPLEFIGIAYYGLIFLSYLVFFLELVDASLFHFLLLGATICAFLFSLYLIFIQAFTLKEWCTLCLTSAFFCTLILVSALASSQSSLPLVLGEYQPLILLVHLTALAMGLGAATVADIFFLKFLKDFYISEGEHDVLNTLAQVMWCSLAGIVVATVGEAIAHYHFNQITGQFMMSAVALVVVIINGALLNLYVTPKLLHISKGEKHDHKAGELHSIHRVAFISGAISFVSWYTMFILTVTPTVPYSFFQLLGFYGAGVIVAAFSGRALEYIVLKRRSDEQS